MRISDWSSDVCSSDLVELIDRAARRQRAQARPRHHLGDGAAQDQIVRRIEVQVHRRQPIVIAALHGDIGVAHEDRKSTRLNSKSLMRISYAVFCLNKTYTQTADCVNVQKTMHN